MTEIDKIKFKIWAIKQDILHRSDMIDRCRDEKHINLIRSNIKADEEEIVRLRAKLKELERGS